MVLFQLTPTRFITIYIAQGSICAFFIFLAYKILRRDTKRLNLIFSGFYLSSSFGLIMNFIYGPLTDVNLVLILNFITNFAIFYSLIFLVVFDLILLKSEKVMTNFKQLAILIGYGALMFGMFFFLFLPEPGVTMNPSTNWSPVWSVPFFIYVATIETVGALIPILYLNFRIYKRFEDETLKRKWKSFHVGFISLAIFMYGIFISNTLNISIVRTITGLIGLILAILGGYLMYKGVGRQLEK